ncbi:MAG: hypothetical protein MJE68_00040, partial [Proteobacteria bacterium]|nr:hypothetical protein [Pseudomonadota bacterium]
SIIVKLMEFWKNTPSPEGATSKVEGVGGNNSRISDSSSFSVTPSSVKIIGTVVLGVVEENCTVSVSMK